MCTALKKHFGEFSEVTCLLAFLRKEIRLKNVNVDYFNV